MSHPLNDDLRRKERSESAALRKSVRAQERADVQLVFTQASARRLLWSMLETAGFDGSAFHADKAVMAHRAGWRDACNFWLAQIRAHCPEREQQMRNEAAQPAPNENEDDRSDDDHDNG